VQLLGLAHYSILVTIVGFAPEQAGVTTGGMVAKEGRTGAEVLL